MTQKFSWTASLGRWWGVALRVHIFFLLFAAIIFYFEWQYLQMPGSSPGTALATLIILFTMVVLHELAHAFSATTLGGRLKQIVVSPWGGESDVVMPLAPREQLIVHLSGPFFNATSFAIGTLILILSGNANLGDLTNPLDPPLIRPGQIDLSIIQIITWVNFMLLIVNLIPAYPFDGAKIIRSAVRAYNPRVSTLKLETGIMGFGIATGLVMFVMAWLMHSTVLGPVKPTWFLLVIAGMVVIFTSRYSFHVHVVQAQLELQMLDQYMQYDSLFEQDANNGSNLESEAADSYLSEFEQDAIADWLHDQQPGSEYAEKLVALDEEKRVDVILEKLHRDGITALSEEEKTFLNRISLQYRQRRELNES